MELTKETAKKLRRGDFIPNGKAVDIRQLEFRKTEEEEVFQCCCQTSLDPQSGPIFCGDVAEFVAFMEYEKEDGEKIVGAVGLCGKRSHKPPIHPVISG